MVAKSEHHLKTECPIACALDIFGDHWTLLIIRDLMLHARHEYKDLLAAEEGISSNILSDRLKKLEQEEIISSIPHPESARRKLYYLTEKGKDLINILLDLARWSDKYLKDRVDIPPEKRPFIDSPADKIEKSVLQQLSSWEQEFVTK